MIIIAFIDVYTYVPGRGKNRRSRKSKQSPRLRHLQVVLWGTAAGVAVRSQQLELGRGEVFWLEGAADGSSNSRRLYC